MFSWICPKCGREVPPSYTECPDCAPAKAPAPPVAVSAGSQAPSAPPTVVPEAHPAPPPGPSPSYVTPTARVAPPPAAEAPARERGIHPWVMMLLAAAGIVALLAVLYLYVLPKRQAPSTTQQPAASTEQQAQTAAPAAAPKTVHPYAKFLEVTGLRVNEDNKQRAQLQFIVVNHSAAELPEMRLEITVQSAGKSLFDFPYTLPSLGPYETKEGTATLKTDLKPYEMPDWQFLKASFDITSAPQ